MEKQMEMKEMKSVDMQCIVAGAAVLFCVLAAIFGYESLSIGGVIIFALVCVMGCMLKDWAAFCRELVEEDLLIDELYRQIKKFYRPSLGILRTKLLSLQCQKENE